MTPVDILHAIVSTEEQARALYSDAKEKEELFASRLEEDTARLRAEIFEKAEAEIDEFDREETARADRAVLEISRRLETELLSASERFEKHKAALVDRVFGIVVSGDA